MTSSSSYLPIILVSCLLCLSVGYKLDLLRFDSSGNQVSSDLGDYEFFECTGEEDDRSCKLQATTSASAEFIQSDDPVNQYLFGVLVYSALNVVGIVLVPVGVILWILVSLICCCCRCCKKKKTQTQVQPTSASASDDSSNHGNQSNHGMDETKHSSDREAHEGNENNASGEEKESSSFPGLKNVNPIYAGCLSFSLLGFTVLILLSFFLGIRVLSENSGEFYRALNGVMNLTYAIQSPLVDFILNVVSQVLAPSMDSTRDLINMGVNLTVVVNVMTSVNETLSLLPSSSLVVLTLKDVKWRTYNVSYICQELYNELGTLEDITVDAYDICKELRNDMTSFDAALLLLDEDLGDLEDAVGLGNDAYNEMIGYGNQVSGILGSYERVSDGGDYPNSADFTAVLNSGNPDSLPHLSSGNIEGDTGNLGTLITKLQGFRSAFTDLPSLNDAAVGIENMLAVRDAALANGGLIAELNAAVDSLETSLSQLPDLMEIKFKIWELHELAVALDLGRVNDALDAVAVEAQPLVTVLTTLSNLIERYLGVVEILPSLEQLVLQLESVNRTILELPKGMDKIYDIYDEVNDKITEQSAKIEKILYDIGNSTETINYFLFNLEGDREVIGNMSQTIDDAFLNALDFAEINATLDDAHAQRDYDFTSLRGNIDAFEDSLTDLDLDDSDVEVLHVAHDLLGDALSLLNQFVTPSTGDLVVVLNDYAGIYTCKLGSQACTQDADCGGGAGDYCLVDKSRVDDLIANLTALGSLDLGDMLTSVDSFLSSQATDFSSYLSDITGIYDSLHGYDLSSVNASIADIMLRIEEVDFTDYYDDIDGTVDTIEAVDFAGYIDMVEDLGGTIDELIDDKLPLINKWRGTAEAFKDFLGNEEEGLSYYLGRISKSHLESIRATRGSAAALIEVLRVVDEVSLYFHEKQDGFKISETEYAGKYAKDLRILDRIGAEEATGNKDLIEHGSIYYMTGLMNSSRYVRVSREPLVSGIYYNTQGERYAHDATCVADTCFEHSTEVMWKEPMDEWDTEFPFFSSTSFTIPSLNLEQLLLVFWVSVFIGMLLGVWTLLCPLCSCWKGCYTCQRTPACLMTSCFICQLPWIFLITAFLLPFVVIVNDTCATGTKVGVTYLEAYGDGICTHRFKGEGTLYACTMNKTLPDSVGNVTVGATVNIVDVYKEVFTGTCDFAEGVDPVADAIRSLAVDVATLPRRAVDKMLKKKMISKRNLRDPLTDIPKNASSTFGKIFSEFLIAEAEEAFDCAHVSAIYNSYADATCTSVMEPLVLMVGIWYLAAWLMACCAIPAGCLWCNKQPIDWNADARAAEEEHRRRSKAKPKSHTAMYTSAAAVLSHDEEQQMVSMMPIRARPVQATQVLPQQEDAGKGQRGGGGGDEVPAKREGGGNQNMTIQDTSEPALI